MDRKSLREALVVGINSYPFLKKKKLGDLNLKAAIKDTEAKVALKGRGFKPNFSAKAMLFMSRRETDVGFLPEKAKCPSIAKSLAERSKLE